MESNCIFCKILKSEIPANIIYEDNLIIAFDDVDPKAPIHKLIIPRKHIETLNDLTLENKNLIGHMTLTAAKLAEKLGIHESGYRVIMNCNEDGGQAVYHLHMHLLGGKPLKWQF